MALQNLNGYPAVAWSSVLALISYLSGQVTTDDVETAQTLLETSRQSLVNTRESLNAFLFGSAMSRAYAGLTGVTELALNLPASVLTFLSARLTAIQAAELGSVGLPQAPLGIQGTIPFGQPAVPAPLYLEFLLGFRAEVPPAGLTGANFAAQAGLAAAAWSTALTALLGSGQAFTNDILDQVESMRDAALLTAQEVANVSLGTTDLVQAWNQLVVVPCLARVAGTLMSDPTSSAAQDTAVARYLVLQAITTLSISGTNLRSAPPVQVRLVTVRRGDTLMRIAARELGDFERFQEIASLNSLVPPYIGNTAQTGVALPGQQIYVPTTQGGASGPVQSNAYQAPSYERAYLGVDIFYGPLDQDMQAWTGDLQTISGYDNLGFSLGRRIRTPVGALLFHQEFGSRVPGEIGNILTLSNGTATYLGAYATSCFLSDPRVAAVSSLTVSVQTEKYGFGITADITPNGANTPATSVDEVFGSAGA